MAGAKKIFLVEDDSDIASLLQLSLKDEGYEIIHEADGARAVELLEKHVWDAVILDLMLPGVDGLEICRRIRQMSFYLPVIIISARSSETDRITGLETGADDYLAKPFSVQELIAYPFVVQLLIIAVLPACVEEFVFRGLIYHSYRKNGILGAAVLSGLVFGLMHLNINQLSYAAVMGIIFALLVEATGSMYSSMLAHYIQV